MNQHGEQIFAHVEDPETGAIMCPYCDLEMGWFEPEDGATLHCGNGHWISAEDLQGD